MRGVIVIFWKELADHFNSMRFLILFMLIFLSGMAATYIAAQTIRGSVSGDTEFVFLALFTTSGGALPSFFWFLSLFVPIIGLSLGFDAVNSEQNSGNLSRLLSQPIYRDSIINAKFLSGLVTLAILVFSILAVVAGMGLRLIGVPPSGEEVQRLIIFFFVTVVYGAFWMALAVLFSTLSRSTATSALASFGLWIFFFFFMTLIAGIVADAVAPVSQGSPAEVVVTNFETSDAISRLSPSNLYGELTIALLVPTTRALGTFGMMLLQLGPALPLYTDLLPTPLPLGQSLLLIWPHVVAIIALTALCFAASYIRFMKQEIRST